ncbi:hypothetical protein ACO0LG_22600 [Undibacterium sp. Ji42W]|uniref:hypothetical protein n=1 Tax=Undibacterium sp. Ji42W TaxID=3413039 RepID=UPI003BF34477
MHNKDRAGQLISEIEDDGFTELVSEREPVPAKKHQDTDFEKRLWNWGQVVGDRSRSGGNCSSAWAAQYVANRDSRLKLLAIKMGVFVPKTTFEQMECNLASDDARLDGWLIEAAWTMLATYDDKQALRCKYVLGWRDEQIRKKLGLRGLANVRFVLSRGKVGLKQVIANRKTPVIIQPTTCMPVNRAYITNPHGG